MSDLGRGDDVGLGVGLGHGLRGGGLGRGLAHSGLPKIAKSKIINFLRGAGRTRVETRLE